MRERRISKSLKIKYIKFNETENEKCRKYSIFYLLFNYVNSLIYTVEIASLITFVV
jgi:hypothetical protein